MTRGPPCSTLLRILYFFSGIPSTLHLFASSILLVWLSFIFWFTVNFQKPRKHFSYSPLYSRFFLHCPSISNMFSFNFQSTVWPTSVLSSVYLSPPFWTYWLPAITPPLSSTPQTCLLTSVFPAPLFVWPPLPFLLRLFDGLCNMHNFQPSLCLSVAFWLWRPPWDPAYVTCSPPFLCSYWIHGLARYNLLVDRDSSRQSFSARDLFDGHSVYPLWLHANFGRLTLCGHTLMDIW